MGYQEAKFRSRHVPTKRETLAESKHDFKARINELFEMSKQHLHNEEPPSVEGERSSNVEEPAQIVKMSLAMDLVLKPNTRINVPLISAYRKWLKAEQRMTNLLADTTTGKSFIQMRLAATVGAEERLKQTGELVGLLPHGTGPPSIRAQDILHQYYDEFGLPTADDKAMLAQIAAVNIRCIDYWFRAKEFRVSAVRAMDRLVKYSKLSIMNSHELRTVWKPQMPSSRH